MIDSSRATQFEESVLNRLAKIEALIAGMTASDQNDYPTGFLTPAEAQPYLKKKSVQQVHAMCRSAVFKPGSELLDTSPPGSERPTYLINVAAYFKRLSQEQG